MPDEPADLPPEVPPKTMEGTPGPSAEGAPTESTEDWGTRYKYLLADFENFRRRVERDREGIQRHARAALIRELLPIIEAFQSARGAVESLPPTDPLRHGLDLLDREWRTFLKHEGVAPVAKVGEPFRAEEEEAVGEAPASATAPAGSVAEVVQQGYRFFGGVLRPAKVVVAREGGSATPPTASPSPEDA